MCHISWSLGAFVCVVPSSWNWLNSYACVRAGLKGISSKSPSLTTHMHVHGSPRPAQVPVLKWLFAEQTSRSVPSLNLKHHEVRSCTPRVHLGSPAPYSWWSEHTVAQISLLSVKLAPHQITAPSFVLVLCSEMFALLLASPLPAAIHSGHASVLPTALYAQARPGALFVPSSWWYLLQRVDRSSKLQRRTAGHLSQSAILAYGQVAYSA